MSSWYNRTPIMLLSWGTGFVWGLASLTVSHLRQADNPIPWALIVGSAGVVFAVRERAAQQKQRLVE